MKFDLAFVLIDLDEPLYRVAASEMIRSARRAYKDHDMRIVQLTDNRSEHHPDVDGVFSIDTDVKGRQFCQAKGHLMAEYALQADRPVIFCDVDLIWNNDGILRTYVIPGRATVMERYDIIPMPYNTGIVVAGGNDREFWTDYRVICGALPPEVCGWYGDQFAMLAAVHADESHERVVRIDMNKIAPAIDELPAAPLTTPAVHFKGDRKKLMGQYARMLDKGKVFDFVRPNVTVEIDMGEQRNTANQGWAF